MAKELRRNMTAIYNKVTIRDLIKLAPNVRPFLSLYQYFNLRLTSNSQINWLKIIRNDVLETITEDEEIILFDIQYLKYLNENLPTYCNR